MQPVNVGEYERLAEELLEPGAFGYFAGGAGDEWTLRENRAAFERWVLRPRVLVDVSAVSTSTTVLGTEISLPVLVAPVAFQRVAHPDGELATARAAAAAGTIMCLSTMATTGPAEVAVAAPGGPRWLQIYVFKDRGITRALIEQAVEAGFSALVLTVDTPFLGRRERDLRTGFRIPPEIRVPAAAAAVGPGAAGTPQELLALCANDLSWRDLEALAADSPLPVLAKGILTAADARLAAAHGASGVIVSNHGGRQLDGVAAALDALPEVAEAVGVEVLMDGGVSRGTDVVKALALGARAVLVGRAALWGLAARGEQGVAHVLELLRAEVELALALLGRASPADVDRATIAPCPPSPSSAPGS
jgi:isopentenyl diphosphate isomerase/L-lactate dehydrogenase-like FMN-dependent dehydrogenase